MLSNLQSFDLTICQMPREGNYANMLYMHLNVKHAKHVKYAEVGVAAISVGMSYLLHLLLETRGFPVRVSCVCLSISCYLQIEKSGATGPPRSSRSIGASRGLLFYGFHFFHFCKRGTYWHPVVFTIQKSVISVIIIHLLVLRLLMGCTNPFKFA